MTPHTTHTDDTADTVSITRLRCDALKEGMVLAQDVEHFNGRLILPKETILEKKDIRILRMWGIPEAFVRREAEACNDNGEGAIGPDQLALLEKKVKEHFRFADMDHEVNKELFRLSVDYYSHSPEGWQNASTIPAPLEKTEEDTYLAPLPYADLEDLVKDAKQPSLPSIVVRLNEAINHPRCTSTHIAEIVSKDTSLTARLLKLVNSPFYGFPQEITSIARAVTIVGSKQLSLLAVATVVASTFKNIPPDYLNMESFWKHSVTSGIIARIIASYNQNANTELYFLAGLLHDIGRLIIFQEFPQFARQILLRSAENPALMHHLEEEVLGVAHTQLGGLLMKNWHLSNSFEDSCLHHHRPLEARDCVVTAVVHVSDIIATAMLFGNSGEYYVPPLDPKAWSTIGLPASILAPTITQAENLLKGIFQFYLPRE